MTSTTESLSTFLFCRGAFAERSFDRPPKVALLGLKLAEVNGIEVLNNFGTITGPGSFPCSLSLPTGRTAAHIIRIRALRR